MGSDVVDKGGNDDHKPGDLLADMAEDEFCRTSSSFETSSVEEPHGSSTGARGRPPGKTDLAMEDSKAHEQDHEIHNLNPKHSDIFMMKERFSKLLLGEDMSGCGKGVCTALAISNAITNLCATIFGQLWRLEPLSPEKKTMWRREMEWLLCVSDHIVELIPSWQTFPDGRNLEVMTCRPRSDLYINLPALKKLDNMLLGILDSFSDPEFWYVDQGILTPDSGRSGSFRGTLNRREEKWWLPVPQVPHGGLHEDTRKELQHKRECTSQILKAATVINSNTLAEMEVPDSYLSSLPKNGRASLGDAIYRYIASDQFSPECLLDCLDLSSEHQALEVANRVEASIYTWRRRTTLRPVNNRNSSATTKSSWEMVKDMIIDADKRELLADRAETLLLCLKQRFPALTQTALDMSKIQFNKDIGKSILESYSRVLESLAFCIVARIDDLLYVDDFNKRSEDQSSTVPTVTVITQKKVSVPVRVPASGATPYATAAYATTCFSSVPPVSPASRERFPLIDNKSHNRGFSVKKVFTSYLNVEPKNKTTSDAVETSQVISSSNSEILCSRVQEQGGRT